MRRLLSIPGITFAVWFAWKLALLLGTSQPVPSNDAFFYDGPVVNYLLHGRYCNPSLAQVLPISGTEVFCAYPPLYQFVLLGWMKLFGTSALAAMGLHVMLLGIYAGVVLLILRQLNVPALAVNLAGLFLFSITFHDRPDTLAHVLGAMALLALVRGLSWPAAAFLLLTFATSLQIGGIYSLALALLTVGNCWRNETKLPWWPALALGVTLAGLVVLVKLGQPLWWAGFLEHVKITPSITGWRVPRLEDLLKVGRTVPGILLALAGLAWLAMQRGRVEARLSAPLITATAVGLADLALIGGCLFLLTPNTIHIGNYLQPVVVGCFLGALAGTSGISRRLRRAATPLFLLAALLVSVRAIGLTTWGVACARDVSRAAALARVHAELDSVPPGSTVLLGTPYLYAAAQRTNLTWLHSDWPAVWSPGPWEANALIKLRPARMIVTQFDYYRREQATLNELRQRPELADLRIVNTARVAPPDASPALQRVVQHVSWAPVIVEFVWRDSPPP